MSIVRQTRLNNKTLDAIRKNQIEYQLIMTSIYRNPTAVMAMTTPLDQLLGRSAVTLSTAQETALAAMPTAPARVNNKTLRNFIRTPLGEAILIDCALNGDVVRPVDYTHLTGRDWDVAVAPIMQVPMREAIRRANLLSIKYMRMYRHSFEVELAITMIALLGSYFIDAADFKQATGRVMATGLELPTW